MTALPLLHRRLSRDYADSSYSHDARRARRFLKRRRTRIARRAARRACEDT